MKTNREYTNAPADVLEDMKNLVDVEDALLPKPEEVAQIIKDNKKTMVTMYLKQRTVKRYKTFATKKGIGYQTFISSVLDNYAKAL
jgi:predicted DNA binding CopG/RHH family protein